MRIRSYLFLIVAVSVLGAMLPASANARSKVTYQGLSRGTILINTKQRRLYYGLGNGQAYAYKVGVGRRGRQWTGTKIIRSKRIRPAWSQTRDILIDTGASKKTIPGGSPSNPMGAAALLLSGGGQYAIHGTNNPKSIGGFVSYGCIRMYNRDIMHLYKRVWPGTKVIVK